MAETSPTAAVRASSAAGAGAETTPTPAVSISAEGYRLMRRLMAKRMTDAERAAMDALPEGERLEIARAMLRRYEADLAQLDHKIAYHEGRGGPKDMARLRDLRIDRAAEATRVAGFRELIAREEAEGAP